MLNRIPRYFQTWEMMCAFHQIAHPILLPKPKSGRRAKSRAIANRDHARLAK